MLGRMKRLLIFFLLLPIAFSTTPFRFINATVDFNNESVFISYWNCGGDLYSLKEFFDSFVFVLYLLEENSSCDDYELVFESEEYNLLHFEDCSFYNGEDFYYHFWSCNNYSHFALESYSSSVDLYSFMSVCNSNLSIKSPNFNPIGCTYEGASFKGFIPSYEGSFILQEFSFLNTYSFTSSWLEEEGASCKGDNGFKYCTLNNYEYVVYNENYSIHELPVFAFKQNSNPNTPDYFLIFVIIVLALAFILFKHYNK